MDHCIVNLNLLTVCSFIKPLLGHLQKQFMDHPGVCLQQVEICYFMLVAHFLIPCVWGFCISLMEKESFRKNLKVEKSLQINDSAVPVRWITGKITTFCKIILMMSCKVLGLDNMYSTTDCFHWAIADWSHFIIFIIYYIFIYHLLYFSMQIGWRITHAFPARDDVWRQCPKNTAWSWFWNWVQCNRCFKMCQ